MAQTSDYSPKLRFPEFSTKWATMKLSCIISSLDSGVSVNAGDDPATEGKPGVLKTSCVYGGMFYPNENKEILSNETARAKLNPKSNSILISRMNTPQLVGHSGFIDKDYPNLFVPDRLWLATINSDHHSKFVSTYLSSSKMMSKISSAATGTSGSMKNISQQNFLKLEVSCPAIEEQQKIASFLTTVDDKIQQLIRKKELLERYKKGVMQKLFSQEIRFKDDNGKDFPEWDVVELSTIATKVIKKNKDNRINHVLTNSATYGIISQQDYFEKDIANQNNLAGYYVVDLNDFVYNPRISNQAPVGPIKRNKQKVGVMSPLYTVFRFNTGALDFFEYYFETTLWHEYLKSVANYGARHDRMSISLSDLFKMPVPLPTIDEQQKIAGFILSIDRKIKNATRYLELSENFKKGLLQQMFV